MPESVDKAFASFFELSPDRAIEPNDARRESDKPQV
jgi:hypothetical protein